MNEIILSGMFAGYLRGLEKSAAGREDMLAFSAFIKRATAEYPGYATILRNAQKNFPKTNKPMNKLAPVTQQAIAKATGGEIAPPKPTVAPGENSGAGEMVNKLEARNTQLTGGR